MDGHRIRFGDKMSDRSPQVLKNRHSFLSMATVSVFKKMSGINPCNAGVGKTPTRGRGQFCIFQKNSPNQKKKDSVWRISCRIKHLLHNIAGKLILP